MAIQRNESRPGTGDRASLASATRMIALVTGVTFLMVGVVGFIITGFANFAETTDEHLLWFGINPLHNIVHLALGALGVAMWRTTAQAMTYGYIVLAGYLGAFVYGLVAIGETWDILSINAADNILHLGLAVVGLVIAAMGHLALAGSSADERVRRPRAAPESDFGAPA